MIDELASEYGWGTWFVLSHTLFQLGKFSEKIAERKSNERRLQLDIIRVGTNGDSQSYNSLIKYLEFKQEDKKSVKQRYSSDIPPGFEYKAN